MNEQPELTVLATGLEFPEGPIAMPDGSVLLAEIARGTFWRFGTSKTHARPPDHKHLLWRGQSAYRIHHPLLRRTVGFNDLSRLRRAAGFLND